MTLAEQKAVVAHTSEAFSDTEPNVVTEAAKAVLKDSEARGGGVQMLGVDKIYPGSTVKALDDFNLEINPGEMVVLLGGSGCGKSTLLKHIIGLYAPQKGDILIQGDSIVQADERHRREIMRRFGVTYQEDRPVVEQALKALHENGTYPPSLKG